MKYDSSNSANIGRAERMNDKYDEGTASEKVAQIADKTHKPARNWAWAHIGDSYDWMDSHSILSTRDPIH